MKQVVTDYKRLAAELTQLATRVVESQGVPVSLDDVDAMTDRLYSTVLVKRTRLEVAEVRAIVEEFGYTLDIADGREYKATQLHKLIREAAGLVPEPELSPVAVYDPVTERERVQRVAPWTAPDESRGVFARRLASRLDYAVKAASRALVVDTARGNGLAWARQLNGETCGFCSMLASRGAVYSSEDKAHFSAHPHCDCTATIVKPGGVYEGISDAVELRALYEAMPGRDRQKLFNKAVASGLTPGNITKDSINNFLRKN